MNKKPTTARAMARRINAQLQWRRLLGGLLTDVFLAALSLFLWACLLMVSHSLVKKVLC